MTTGEAGIGRAATGTDQAPLALVRQAGSVLLGSPEPIVVAVDAFLARGHVLFEDVPGVGKTLLAKALARSIGGTFGRVQGTPDLLPSDLTGISHLDEDRRSWVFRPGPLFNNIVLVDEINRATPRTQSALLEAMAEGQVTVDGTTHPLPEPFLVIATQNPIEHEGTYPLPESQLDRFLMRVSVGYPDRQAEIEVLDLHSDHSPLDDIGPVADAADVEAMITSVRSVHVAPSLRGYLVDLADVTRRHPQLALGVSPRATLSLQRVARGRAAAQGRSYVVPDDIKALADPVLAHRLLVTPEAQLQGVTSSDILADVLARVPVPTTAD